MTEHGFHSLQLSVQNTDNGQGDKSKRNETRHEFRQAGPELCDMVVIANSTPMSKLYLLNHKVLLNPQFPDAMAG